RSISPAYAAIWTHSLSLHDALPISAHARVRGAPGGVLGDEVVDHVGAEALAEIPDVERDAEQVRRTAGIHRVLDRAAAARSGARSEEHTSELQSRENLVCRLLLEKK